jgi:ABC-type nitrate/sulfonate/bicarbonate transport system permease component
MTFRAIQRSSDPLLPGSRMDAGGRLAIRAAILRNFIGTLYTVAGLGLFIGVWLYAASQLPRSRLVTPLEVGSDIRTNFLYSPRLGVFGLGKVGYGSLLLYTVGNVLTGLATGGAIGIVIGSASARLRFLRLFVDPVVLVLDRTRPGGCTAVPPLVWGRSIHAGLARCLLQCRYDGSV